MAKGRTIHMCIGYSESSNKSSNNQTNLSQKYLPPLTGKKTDELKLYRPPTSDPEEISKREEQDEIFRFLASLDSSYEYVRSQILLLPELPSIDDVMDCVEGEESRRVVVGSQSIGD
jgi:hypothetical protein